MGGVGALELLQAGERGGLVGRGGEICGGFVLSDRQNDERLREVWDCWRVNILFGN